MKNEANVILVRGAGVEVEEAEGAGEMAREWKDDGLELEFVEAVVAEHVEGVQPRLERLWDYYRNDMLDGAIALDGGNEWHGRSYRLAQERGLPGRLRRRSGGYGEKYGADREIVIENDIAWRVHTLVDFMLGKPFAIQSQAKDAVKANLIESLLQRVFDGAGGLAFFQHLGLLGSVYGHVDVLLHVEDGEGDEGVRSGEEAELAARRFRLEIIEAPRGIAVLNPGDYRRLDGYVVNYRQELNELGDEGWWSKVRRGVNGDSVVRGLEAGRGRRSVERTEVWTPGSVTVYEGGAGAREVVEEGVNRLGRIPVVHIQNLPQAFFYEGLSEVEPLIPLQDELNTRLSDRANRVTFQSFKMYLGKGIEGFLDRPVGPGQMWATENLEASIQAFGGDAANPSEDAHINEIREAMDKTSGVTSVAAGLLRERIGNLTSENALRMVLMGLLAKTEKKRLTYGGGIQELCELILHAADVTGVLRSGSEERKVSLHWPSALPENETQKLKDAELKVALGVPREQVLAELGYGKLVDRHG